MHHAVYGRTGAPCPRCATPIERVAIAGRSAHFCPNLAASDEELSGDDLQEQSAVLWPGSRDAPCT